MSHADHAHVHTHAPGHQHHGHHHHGDEDPYYIDQLCQLGIASAFGGISLYLYFFSAGDGQMLDLLLSRRFHIYLLLGGLAIMLMSIVRAYCLWQQAREDRLLAVHHHDHAHHGHEHHHDHEHHHHDHEHGHGPEHAHDHAHGHEHHHQHGPRQGQDHPPGHSHEPGEPGAENSPGPDVHADQGHHGREADHEHGWAPWRYVVLMVPIVLFVLGLPNTAPTAPAPNLSDMEEPLVEAPGAAALAAFAGDPLSQLTLTGSFSHERAGKAEDAILIEYRKLFDSAQDQNARQYYKNKMVLLKGQLRHQSDNPRVAIIARFLRQCCSADAVPISIPLVGRRDLTSVADTSWVHVWGKVDYVPRGNQHILRILVQGPQNILATRQDESQFIDY